MLKVTAASERAVVTAVVELPEIAALHATWRAKLSMRRRPKFSASTAHSSLQ
jgi:hypothetical protein